MSRIVDDVTGDPMRIDGGTVERHGQEPVVGRKFGELLAQRAGLIMNAIESRFNINLSRLRSELLLRRLSKVGSGLRDGGIEEEPHPEDHFPDVIGVLRDGPHPVNGSPKLIPRTQSSDSCRPLQRQAVDCGDRTGIAPIIRVEAAFSTPLDTHVPDSSLPARPVPPIR